MTQEGLRGAADFQGRGRRHRTQTARLSCARPWLPFPPPREEWREGAQAPGETLTLMVQPRPPCPPQDVIQVSKKFLPSMAVGYSSPKLTLHVGDGFEFMKQNRDAFDIIITDSSDPVGERGLPASLGLLSGAEEGGPQPRAAPPPPARLGTEGSIPGHSPESTDGSVVWWWTPVSLCSGG